MPWPKASGVRLKHSLSPNHPSAHILVCPNETLSSPKCARAIRFLASFRCHPMCQFLYAAPGWITSPMPFSSSKSCPFFKIQKSPQLHNDLPPGPDFNTLRSIWVLRESTIHSFHIYHVPLWWHMFAQCFHLPVALFLTFQMHYAFQAYIACKHLRMGLCPLFWESAAALGQGPA